MPSLANITMATRTFKPAGREQNTNTVTYEDRSSGQPVGYATLRVRKQKNTSVRRVRAVVTVPVLQAASAADSAGFTPVPRLSHNNGFTFEAVCANLSSAEQRAEIIALAKAFVESALLEAIVVDQEEITG